MRRHNRARVEKLSVFGQMLLLQAAHLNTVMLRAAARARQDLRVEVTADDVRAAHVHYMRALQPPTDLDLELAQRVQEAEARRVRDEEAGHDLCDNCGRSGERSDLVAAAFVLQEAEQRALEAEVEAQRLRNEEAGHELCDNCGRPNERCDCPEGALWAARCVGGRPPPFPAMETVTYKGHKGLHFKAMPSYA